MVDFLAHKKYNGKKRTVKSALAFFIVLLFNLPLASCGTSSSSSSGTPPEDTSSSGAAASSVGSAINSGISGGTIARTNLKVEKNLFSFLNPIHSATASAPVCPSIETPAGQGCTAGVSNNDITLTFSNCSYTGSNAVWNGKLEITGAVGATVCGAVQNTGNVIRQYISGEDTPGTATRRSGKNTSLTVDDHSANLGNYESDVIPTLLNSGYGDKVTWSGGHRTGIVVAHRIFTNGTDYSIYGNLTIAEATGTDATRTVSGTSTIYHNKAKTKGTTTFSNVVYSKTCCQPISGTVSTAFSSTAHTGAEGAVFNGKSESLTFTGCGTAQFTDAITKTPQVVILDHCF